MAALRSLQRGFIGMYRMKKVIGFLIKRIPILLASIAYA